MSNTIQEPTAPTQTPTVSPIAARLLNGRKHRKIGFLFIPLCGEVAIVTLHHMQKFPLETARKVHGFLGQAIQQAEQAAAAKAKEKTP